MNSHEYQSFKDDVSCFMPSCPNTKKKNPGMNFVNLRKELKEKWCRSVNRQCPKRALFCCEEHLNFEEDLENYHKWTIGAKPRLALNATLKNVPKLGDSKMITYLIGNATTTTTCTEEFQSSTAKAVQLIVPRNHDASVMVKPNTTDKSTNFRARVYANKEMPSLISQPSTSADEVSSPSPSLFGWSPTNYDSSSSTTSYECNKDGRDTAKYGREHLLKIIKNNPKMYLGVPENYWWVVNFVARACSLVHLHIIITLFKIKNNDTFQRISDEFEIARCTISSFFEKNVVALATYLQNFIYLPSALEIKKELPFAFKNRYANVQCIIDCFEIQIEKPTNPIKQGQTWSQYKSCNTVKFLIGCTPAGLISFISTGYGGRISDKALTEISRVIDILPPYAIIMADRGFKEIESILSVKNVKLLRPPSASAKTAMTKKEVIKTKVIASLRVHIERVIRRVREFQMLKPHSVVNHKHVAYIDEIVVIACGLINLQDRIIKED